MIIKKTDFNLMFRRAVSNAEHRDRLLRMLTLYLMNKTRGINEEFAYYKVEAIMKKIELAMDAEEYTPDMVGSSILDEIERQYLLK